MKFIDLLRMSGSSLWKRKLRTILTVLGVVIGTASIVVMISLGLGLNKASMEMIEKYGGLTTITVSTGGNSFSGPGMVSMSVAGSDSSKEKEEKFLDDKLLEQIKAMEHVNSANPVLETYVRAKYGMYETSMSIQGMTPEALRSLNIPLEAGVLPKEGDAEIKLVYGNMLLQQFYNAKTGQGYWETGVLPDIDLLNDPMFIIYDQDAYWSSQGGGDGSGSGTPVAPPKKYVVFGTALIAGGQDEWNDHSYNAYCDIDLLKAQLKKVFKNKAIPGQPTRSNGKPYKEIFYSNIKVNVDKMDNMQVVQEAIQNLGYQANSNAEWIDSQKQQAGYIQAVLGGIGAVSLFVAAIGITNTMMMSIYERTKEIGVIKVLGCDMRNIRTQFLMEAGYIGFIGGVVGLVLSYAISAIINYVVESMNMGTSGLSYIPAWLSLAAVAFAVLVGMVAGFFPALRAMRLSPLAAIRNE